MNSNQEKSVVVIAKKGYNVLLDIGKQTLMVDCYKSINLSEMFPQDVLEQCTSLQSHLRDGNLVFYAGEDLPEDPNNIQINKLNEIAEQQLSVKFSQHSGRTDAFNINIETTSDISDDIRKKIDAGIDKNRNDIVKQDNKILQHSVTKSVESADKNDSPLGRDPVFGESAHLSEDQLHFKVTMDVDDNTFNSIQKQGHKDNVEKAELDEQDAEIEIEKQNNENRKK